MTKNGFFITLEGIDGSGKTTASKAICQQYKRAIRTQEPSELWTGEQVRRAITNESNTHAFTDFYLFMADRVHHIENLIKPALDDGMLVVSDRYADSTRAYQGHALRNEVSWPKAYIEDVIRPWHFEPHLTLYFDISVSTALERMGGGDRYEKREFLEAVKANYEHVIGMDPGRFVRIDAEQPQEVVEADVLDVVADWYE